MQFINNNIKILFYILNSITLAVNNTISFLYCFLAVSPAIVSITPNNHIANLYESVTLVCSAIGLGNFSFAWEHNGMAISSPVADSFRIDSVMPQHQGQYKCTVTTTYSNFSVNSDAFAMLNLNGNSLSFYI